MVFDELFGLHEHAARSAARVVNLALAGREHGYQCFDNAGGRVELPAPLAFGAGKHAQEIFVHLAQDVASLRWVVTKADGGDQVDQLAQLAVGQLGAGKAFVEDAFEFGVVGFDQAQRVVDAFANVGLRRGGTQRFPAGTLGHPKHVFAGVVVAVFQLGGNVFVGGVAIKEFVGRVAQAQLQVGLAGHKGVGDVFDEDEAQHQVLVFGGVHVGAQFVGRCPEGLFDVVEHFVVNLVTPRRITIFEALRPGHTHITNG